MWRLFLFSLFCVVVRMSRARTIFLGALDDSVHYISCCNVVSIFRRVTVLLYTDFFLYGHSIMHSRYVVIVGFSLFVVGIYFFRRFLAIYGNLIFAFFSQEK